MRQRILLLGVVGLFITLSGCATSIGSDAIFPGDQYPGIASSTQFDNVMGKINSYKGQEIKLAGRIMSLEEQENGYRVLARWLPYPKNLNFLNGPPDPKGSDTRHFTLFFRGKVERTFDVVKGNKFVLEGTVEGTKKMLVEVFGPKKSLLSIQVRCVHVWETGESGEYSDPDSQWPGAVRAKTFCVE